MARKEYKRKKDKRRITKLICLLIAILIVGALLIATVLKSMEDSKNVNTTLIRSETIYVVLTLLFLLPFFLAYSIYAVKRNAYVRVPKIDLDGDENNKKKEDTPEKIQERNQPIGLNDSNSEILVKIKKEEKKEEFHTESRFYMLTKIDHEFENYQAPIYNNKISLSEICDQFRNFSAHQLKLYYDIRDIRRFIAGFSVTHILILQGMSGTGKTSLAYAFGEFLKNRTVVIPIQPMWKERTDLIGYYNEFTKKFNETNLLQKLYEANYNDNIYITVLDEMNIARIEYYFAEFLSLLELPNPEGRNLDVVADIWNNDPKLLHNGQIRLPSNMWFIGTANNDDSTFSIADKVYDRAMIINLDRKAVAFDGEDVKPIQISSNHFVGLMESAKNDFRISKRNLRRIQKLDEYMIEHFHITFGNRIMKQIISFVPVYVACGGEELDALDYLLSRKLIRKLENQNPVYIRSVAKNLCIYLDDLFGANMMPLCKEYIQTIERNV